MKVLALTKYGDRAASTRQRLLQFRPFFQQEGITVDYLPLLDNQYVKQLSDGGNVSPFRIFAAYSSRILALLSRRDFDVLWIHYEIFPYVFGLAERMATLPKRPIVYDFDDAIFHQYDQHSNRLVRLFLGRKLEPLLQRVSACSCGNEYLRAYAQQFCPRSVVIPTVVDTSIYLPVTPSRADCGPVTIGWIGSPSTWAHAKPLIPLLRQLAAEMELRIRVVGAGSAVEHSPEVGFIEWSEENEVCELQKMDIGIMPLPDEPWARGKCGYKLIQYMACGVPVVASPVGVNTEIVRHGENGFLASTDKEWLESLTRLAADPDLCRALGTAGRARIESEFSLKVQAPRMVELLKSVAS